MIVSAILIYKGALIALQLKTILLTAKTYMLAAAQWALNAAMSVNPLMLVCLAIGALIAIAILLIKNWDKVKVFFIGLWDKIKEVFGGVAEWFSEKFNAAKEKITSIVQGVIDWFGENWQSILLFIVNPFAGAFKYLYDNFEGFRNFVNGIIENIKEFFTSLGESIGLAFDSAWNFIVGIWEAVAGWFDENVIQPIIGFFGGLYDKITGIGEDIKETLLNVFTSPVDLVIEAWERVSNFFGGLLDKAKEITGKAFNASVSAPQASSAYVPRFAGGTDYSPSTFIAGENGPELITNASGSKVFTAFETNNIFKNISSPPEYPSAEQGVVKNITLSLGKYQNLEPFGGGVDDEQRPSGFTAGIRQTSYREDRISVNYNPSFTINGGNHNEKQMENVLDGLIKDGYKDIKRLVKEALEEIETRKLRLSNG